MTQSTMILPFSIQSKFQDYFEGIVRDISEKQMNWACLLEKRGFSWGAAFQLACSGWLVLVVPID